VAEEIPQQRVFDFLSISVGMTCQLAPRVGWTNRKLLEHMQRLNRDILRGDYRRIDAINVILDEADARAEAKRAAELERRIDLSKVLGDWPGE